MRVLTSAAANKLLKQYNEKLALLYQQEDSMSTYTEVEGVPPIKPDYNFQETRDEVVTCHTKIAILKHAINQFNVDHLVGDTGMTVDQILVRLAMLNKEKQRLYSMRAAQPKEIKSGFGARSNVLEYTVLNYDPKVAGYYYSNIEDEITKLQLALDIDNSTVKFEVPI